MWRGGTAAAVPPPFSPGNLALCGSHQLVTPHQCRIDDLLFFLCLYVWLLYFYVICVMYCVPSVLWYCWLGLLTCKNRRPYNLYCVGGDVKPCSFNQSQSRVTKRAWLRTGSEEAARRRVCMCIATRETVEMTRRMSDAGADAVLVITPCFYKNAMNKDALYKHFHSVTGCYYVAHHFISTSLHQYRANC